MAIFSTSTCARAFSIAGSAHPVALLIIHLLATGLEPVGYGVRSVEFLVRTVKQLDADAATLEARQAVLKQIDATGVVATPANSRYNELVVEAGRTSILNGGREVEIGKI